MNNSQNQSNNNSTLRLIGLIAVLAVGIGVAVAYQNGWFASSGTAQKNSSTADLESTKTVLPVNAQRIHFVDSIEQTRSYTGTVRAKRSSELAFELAGKVKEVLVDNGQRVEAGQVIATMGTATLQAQQAATLARLAQSKFLMSELTSGPRKQQIAAATADTAAAKSEYDNAKLRSTRRRELLKNNAISIEEYRQSQSDARTAKASWQAAAERLAELNAGTRQEQLSAQQAAVTQLNAAAKEIEVAINKSNLVAPFAGTITKRYLDPGSIAQPSIPVCRLVEQSKLEAWIGLPVNVATEITTGQQYTVKVAGTSYDVTATAKIQELDAATRTQTVLFEFAADAAQTIVQGQLSRIQITTEVEATGFWVPSSAVIRSVRGLSSLMVLTPGDDRSELFRVHRCDIEIIKTDSNRMLVKGTISNEDLVVANGLHRVANGQLVSLAEPPKPADDSTLETPKH